MIDVVNELSEGNDVCFLKTCLTLLTRRSQKLISAPPLKSCAILHQYLRHLLKGPQNVHHSILVRDNLANLDNFFRSTDIFTSSRRNPGIFVCYDFLNFTYG